MASPYLTDFSAGVVGQGRSASAVPSPPRPSPTKSGQTGSAQVRYVGHWPELLGDLGVLGKVWIETEQSGLSVSQRRSLTGLRVQGLVGHLQSAEYQVRVLLDRCHALSALASRQGLAIEDRARQAVVTMALDASAHPLPLQVFLASVGAKDRPVVPAPHRHPSAPLAAVEGHAVGQLQRDCEALGSEPGFRDVAELSARSSMHPGRLRQAALGRGDDAVAVDPSLVPCALETLADQVHPLAITTGSHGWVSRSVAQFYGHSYVDGQLALRGDGIRVTLDVRAIDSAWVIGQRAGADDGRALRLYDEDGRAMAVIATAADPGACAGSAVAADVGGAAGPSRRGRRCGDQRLWTTLINALTR